MENMLEKFCCITFSFKPSRLWCNPWSSWYTDQKLSIIVHISFSCRKYFKFIDWSTGHQLVIYLLSCGKNSQESITLQKFLGSKTHNEFWYLRSKWNVLIPIQLLPHFQRQSQKEFYEYRWSIIGGFKI